MQENNILEVKSKLQELLPGVEVTVAKDKTMGYAVTLRIADKAIVAGAAGSFIVPNCTLVVLKTEV